LSCHLHTTYTHSLPPSSSILPYTTLFRSRRRRHPRRRTRPAANVVTKYFLTTAIDYSNGDPHLGHALEKVGADCIARYRRLRGEDRKSTRLTPVTVASRMPSSA